MKDADQFYTLKGYQLNSNQAVTSAMEDYLEMICRCIGAESYTRINELAQRLNVKPSSASKMVGKLREQGLVVSERYGIVRPTPAGWKLGSYLLRRHTVLDDFLRTLNQTDSELEQVEQIEHFLDERTINNLEKLNETLSEIWPPE